MRILKAGFIYFLLVFAAGFALAFVRIPFLVPAFGERAAELMEMPVMLMVMLWVSRRLARDHPELPRSRRLLAGCFALALMVAAELLVAYLSGARSPGQYIAERDSVSGSIYLVSLVFFALAPAMWSSRSRLDITSTRKATKGALRVTEVNYTSPRWGIIMAALIALFLSICLLCMWQHWNESHVATSFIHAWLSRCLDILPLISLLVIVRFGLAFHPME